MGLAVSRRVSRHAVVRNRLKRQLREIFRRAGDDIPGGLDIVVIPQAPALEMDFHALKRHFLELLEAYVSRAARFGHGDPKRERADRVRSR